MEEQNSARLLSHNSPGHSVHLKQRTPNFSAEEREFVMRKVEEHSNVIECKLISNKINHSKQQIWCFIRDEFMKAFPTKPRRSANQFKDLYRRLKILQRRDYKNNALRRAFLAKADVSVLPKEQLSNGCVVFDDFNEDNVLHNSKTQNELFSSPKNEDAVVDTFEHFVESKCSILDGVDVMHTTETSAPDLSFKHCALNGIESTPSTDQGTIDVDESVHDSPINLTGETDSTSNNVLTILQTTLKSQQSILAEIKSLRAELKNLVDLNSIFHRNAEALENIAAAYTKINENQKAIADCKSALNIDPNYSKAMSRMGRAYSSLGKFYEAFECYRDALKVEPNNENYKQNMEAAKNCQTLPPEGSSTAAPTGNVGGFDLSGLMNNPAMINMAQQLMSNPQMQSTISNMFASFAGGSTPNGTQATSEAGSTTANSTQQQEQQQPSNTAASGVDELLTMGEQVARQLQAASPDLVASLRNRFQQGNQQSPSNNSNQPPGN